MNVVQPVTNTIPTDTPSVFVALQTLQTSNQQGYNAIVRMSNPPPGIGGMLFSIPDEEKVRLESEITDHYVEDNTTLQDQWALKPEEVTLRGVVAELGTVVQPNTATVPAPNPLPLNPAMGPSLTQTQIQKQAVATATAVLANNSATGTNSLYQYYTNQINAAVASTKDPSGKTLLQAASRSKQSLIFGYFQQLWWGRQVCTIETPWGFWTNMAIKLLEGVQGPDSRFQSDFYVTFKHIRIAADITVQAGSVAGRAAQQSAPVSQNGTAGLVAATPTQVNSMYGALLPGDTGSNPVPLPI
jgi:hypothetical protein